jgi:hypothetical protein
MNSVRPSRARERQPSPPSDRASFRGFEPGLTVCPGADRVVRRGELRHLRLADQGQVFRQRSPTGSHCQKPGVVNPLPKFCGGT